MRLPRRAVTQSEASFQKAVIAMARLFGWLVIHHPDSRRATGAGWVDLTLLHHGRGEVVFAELKRQGGKLRPGQAECLGTLRRAGCRAYLWRPGDWKIIEAVLSGKV